SPDECGRIYWQRIWRRRPWLGSHCPTCLVLLTLTCAKRLGSFRRWHHRKTKGGGPLPRDEHASYSSRPSSCLSRPGLRTAPRRSSALLGPIAAAKLKSTRKTAMRPTPPRIMHLRQCALSTTTASSLPLCISTPHSSSS